jgi:hypothetical protein
MDPFLIIANILIVLRAARAIAFALKSLIALKNAFIKFVKLFNKVIPLE